MSGASGANTSGDDLNLHKVEDMAGLAEALRVLKYRHARRNRDSELTFRELAEKSGLPRAAINDYCLGKSLPRIDRLDILVQTLGASGAEQRAFADARYRIEERRRSRGNRKSSRPRAGETPGRVPRQLPGPSAFFVGRAEQFRMLTSLAASVGTTGAAATVLVDGAGGVGKTSLVRTWAWHAVDRFPDGQLYVDLQGYALDGEPLAPDRVVRGFLEALGIGPSAMPREAVARLGLYRSLLADRRVFVLLDNARNAEQVRDLLPSGPACMAVITSREDLAGLGITHAVVRLSLGLFTRDEADAFLAARLGAARVTAEAEAVGELIELCARLPLALSVVAARAVRRPSDPVGRLVTQIRSQTRLDAFGSEDPVTDLRTVLSWSYGVLDRDSARVFRLLAVGADGPVSLNAVASVAGSPATSVARLLDRLVQASLLDVVVPDRYAMHDLLRLFAHEQAALPEHRDDVREATARLSRYYIHAAGEARRFFRGKRGAEPSSPPAEGVVGEFFESRSAAWSWFEAEQDGLPALLETLARQASDEPIWLVASGLVAYFEFAGRYQAALACHRTALAAAVRARNAEGQAHAHRALGRAHGMLGASRAAQEHLTAAVELFHGLGDREAEARSRLDLSSWAFEALGRYEDALAEAHAASEIFQDAGDEAGLAKALNNTGYVHIRLGELDRALTCCTTALEIQRRLDDPAGSAATWDSLGLVHHRLGDHRRAVECYEAAIDLFRDRQNNFEEAESLVRLGEVYVDARDTVAAAKAWEQAAVILERIGSPALAALRERRRALQADGRPSAGV